MGILDAILGSGAGGMGIIPHAPNASVGETGPQPLPGFMERLQWKPGQQGGVLAHMTGGVQNALGGLLGQPQGQQGQQSGAQDLFKGMMGSGQQTPEFNLQAPPQAAQAPNLASIIAQFMGGR